mmetsp:Transcript_38821/g.82553  ORF Transcript_38821/g.82553 Transcript_38821/m.82553 type:complete len:212 (+) Transcript_38821:30-665(+)
MEIRTNMRSGTQKIMTPRTHEDCGPPHLPTPRHMEMSYRVPPPSVSTVQTVPSNSDIPGSTMRQRAGGHDGEAAEGSWPPKRDAAVGQGAGREDRMAVCDPGQGCHDESCGLAALGDLSPGCHDCTSKCRGGWLSCLGSCTRADGRLSIGAVAGVMPSSAACSCDGICGVDAAWLSIGCETPLGKIDTVQPCCHDCISVFDPAAHGASSPG